MCGIAGVFGKADPATVQEMLKVVRHRGPDDLCLVSGEAFTLGATRLSIVDVEGGRQPIGNEEGTVWAAQNGELYNFPEVQPELLSRGHSLHTRCDTEILPHLYEEYGERLPEHIDGMFAVALWDDRESLGLLARDRTGKKPLYYVLWRGCIYFGSEIKCLLQIPGLERRLDLVSVHHYLSLKHVPCPRTIFEGIRMLPPAHRLRFKPGADPVVEPYWQLDFSTDPDLAKMPEAALVDRLVELMRRGVRRRLMADVPVGFYLSGGVDSSLTTALATEVAGGQIKTFTLTYGAASSTRGKEQDRRWARHVAHMFGTDHHEEEIDFSDFPETLRRILTHFDEPFAGVVSTYFLSQLMARHVKVAVSGDGADELFGSYLTHRLAFPLARYEEYLALRNAELIQPFDSEPEILDRYWAPNDRDWRARIAVLGEREKLRLYSAETRARLTGVSTEDYWHRVFDGLTATDPLNRILEAEFKTIFPDQVLAFVDRLAMAHSLEVRTAFLDTDVIEFVAALPGRLKIQAGTTKHLLKQAAMRYFPAEMIERPKEGFLMPITEWILGDLESYVRDTLHFDRVRRAGVFEPAAVNDLVNDLYSAADNDHFQVNKVYSLLVFHEWFDLYMA